MISGWSRRWPLVARSTMRDDFGIDLARQDKRRRRRLGVAGRPIVVAREAFGVAHAAHLRGDLGREPGVRRAGIGGIDRQTVDQQLAHRRARTRQLIDGRPRRFGIHMVGRHRRDAAPVVQASADQARIDAGRQVGRRLDVHVGPEDQPRLGDGPKKVGKVGLVGVGPLGVGLGAEILDDHLLYVTVRVVQVADRLQRLDPLFARLADADQDAGGERHLQLAGQPDRLQPNLRMLVGRAEMHAALLA